MRRTILGLVILAGFAAASGTEGRAASGDAARPMDADRIERARVRVDAFYRSLPTVDPIHRFPTGVEGPLCGTLRGNAPWVELQLLSDLRDVGHTDWLKAKALFGLSCIWSAGESRCLGSLTEELVEMESNPALFPSLRYAVTGWLERLTQGMSVPRIDEGRYRRRDYEQWWRKEGRWVIQGTCAGAKT